MSRSRIDAILSTFVAVHPHETSALLHSSSCFFFILCAYFVVLPLRDEGAISLGLSSLPGLFVGSLVLTSIAAPVATLIFSLRMFLKASVSLVVFFFLWHFSSAGAQQEVKGLVTMSSNSVNGQNVDVNQATTAYSIGWENLGWFYVSVRIGLFLWIALLNLITISSTWARVIDVMDSESGSRLFGFIGAGATLGQLFGSLFATGMARLGPFLLLFSALLMEFAAQSSKGITLDVSHVRVPEELSPIREADTDRKNEPDGQTIRNRGNSPKSPTLVVRPSTVMSSNSKVSVIAMTVTSSLGRRKLLAQINSFIAVFILAGQLTITGRFLTVVGVTTAICATPFVAFLNLVAIAVWPTWVAVAVSETLRKFVTYVVTRPGRELLFTVVSQDEKYKAKARASKFFLHRKLVCIDVFVQRLGDATAAGMYKLLFSTVDGRASTVSLYGLPVCLLWVVIAFHLGRRQAELAKLRTRSTS
ncbi:TLC ATP/ADP transporter [Prunus dulcis]|uniref:TLC ATP/ADP transporter n=1 Tax=Prunus dulcis TaxID=3755 RepID=A0A4Y1R1Z8_PRUDU|nr:TLC ATP/ADP transporter [Prunus dulcis]